ncbi:MAG: AAA family ATPase [Acidimicrobiales bacterium]
MSTEGVISALLAAVEASPNDDDLRLHLVEQLEEAERFDEAISQIDAMLSADATNCAALVAAVRVHRRAGNETIAAAFEHAQSALAEPEHDVDVHADADPRPIPVEIPDTADELLDAWDETEAIEEVSFGELGAAGVSFDDVGGLSEVKTQLERSFLGPMRNPDLAATFGKSASGGLLLWGPPGCGKTFLARATAGEMGANFYNVGLSEVLDMWIGSSERNLASIFEAARRNTPCVLFFDEIDALGRKRSQLRFSAGLRSVVNQLLSELDGVMANNDGLFVLAATNHPWDIDEALLRPGRFDRRLLVLPPDPAAREAVLRYHLRGRPVGDIDLTALVEATDGFSGADLSFIVETAVEGCLDESMQTGGVVPVTTQTLHEAFDSITPSIGPWLETARNHVMYSNRSGDYDQLEAYLKRHDMRPKRRRT